MLIENESMICNIQCFYFSVSFTCAIHIVTTDITYTVKKIAIYVSSVCFKQLFGHFLPPKVWVLLVVGLFEIKTPKERDFSILLFLNIIL